MTGSTVLPVPRRMADGSVRRGDAVDRVRGHPDVERDEHDVRATGREQGRREPGTGRALDQDPRAGLGTAAASRAAALPTAAPNSAIVIENSRVLDVRTPRKGASPELATASSSSSDRVRGSAIAAGTGTCAASRRVPAGTWAGRFGAAKVAFRLREHSPLARCTPPMGRVVLRAGRKTGEEGGHDGRGRNEEDADEQAVDEEDGSREGHDHDHDRAGLDARRQ